MRMHCAPRSNGSHTSITHTAHTPHRHYTHCAAHTLRTPLDTIHTQNHIARTANKHTLDRHAVYTVHTKLLTYYARTTLCTRGMGGVHFTRQSCTYYAHTQCTHVHCARTLFAHAHCVQSQHANTALHAAHVRCSHARLQTHSTRCTHAVYRHTLHTHAAHAQCTYCTHAR